MKKVLLSCQFITLLTCQLHAQNVGIGTTTPNSTALLHVDVGTSITNGLLVTGTSNSLATVPDLGSGSKMMFYPAKAAFRAGYVNGTQWDNANVGFYSTAMGSNTTASGGFSIAIGFNTIASSSTSTAMGYYTTASGTVSTAMGSGTTASNSYSTAMGSGTNASGDRSTAMGSSTNASGFVSTAMGISTTASGERSIAMGDNTTASGYSSTAMGSYTTASGNFSTAIGSKVSTNSKQGAFVIGDSDPTNQGFATPGLADLFVARFNNGYYLFTSGVVSNIGVAINHNGNFWVGACDRNLKENFQPLNGEDVLQKISKIKFTSWNYKQQDAKIYRHYGIMAQDFYKAFGKDNYGTIGNDTTVNPIDMIGIDMTAIQALEKRTERLIAENIELKKRLDKLERLMMNK